MEDDKKRPAQKAFRMSDDGRELLAQLADRLGLKETGVVELAIRRLAQAEGVGASSSTAASSAQ